MTSDERAEKILSRIEKEDISLLKADYGLLRSVVAFEIRARKDEVCK